jgi:hypothetical protein
MMEKPIEKKAKTVDDWFTKFLILIIVIFGCCLVLYSVYRVVMDVINLNILVLDLIMFGFGFATIWFGLTHFDIKKTDDKIQKIHEKADRITRILHRK